MAEVLNEDGMAKQYLVEHKVLVHSLALFEYINSAS